MTIKDKIASSPIRLVLLRDFNLKGDKAEDQVIDLTMRAGVEMKGTNLWILVFAIFVASIGLNINATAVIIGAMLISPLMGPIMGVGYGVGILDFPLIRLALKNLAISTLIGLIASGVYFFFSPLSNAQSELLSRTTPNIWDVLIATFGGFAGIVGATRKEKSNVIPGVAIATALMPPLCTAGFGLAHGNWSFFLGALYLFAINCVFIAFSSAVIIKALHVQKKKFVDEAMAKRVQWIVSIVVLVTLVPSLYMAYLMVKDEMFRSKATRFVSKEIDSNVSHVVQIQIDARNKKIDVTMVGAFIPPDKMAKIVNRLPKSGLAGVKLFVRQSNEGSIDFTTLKSGVLRDLYAQNKVSLEKREKKIEQLQAQLGKGENLEQVLKGIPDELHALFPVIQNVWISKAFIWDQKTGTSRKSTIVMVLKLSAGHRLDHAEREKIEKWALIRVKPEPVKLVVMAGR
ncbi:MAG: TIGR00341 family protein [Leptospirales bacterium]